MFTIDTSSLVAFFAGDEGNDIDAIKKVLEESLVCLTPAVVAEIISDPSLPREHEKVVLNMPRVPVKEGFWERVGYLRRNLIERKLRARLADALIAQSCIDHKLTLISRDRDFLNIQKYSDLKLISNP